MLKMIYDDPWGTGKANKKEIMHREQSKSLKKMKKKQWSMQRWQKQTPINFNQLVDGDDDDDDDDGKNPK